MSFAIERPELRSSFEWLPIYPVEALDTNLHAVREKGTIRIFCGGANPAVYNDPRFFTAADFAKSARNAAIWVITGPLLVRPEHGVNGLLQLKDNGIIDKLYHRPERGVTGSFHVVETQAGYAYYKEMARLPSVPLSQRRALNIEAFPPDEVQDLAEQTKSLFDRLAGHLGTHALPGWKYLPIQATGEQYTRLSELAESRGPALDHLGPLEIRSLPDAESLVYGHSSA